MALAISTAATQVEPRIQYINERKLRHRAQGPYSPKTYDEAKAGLVRLFTAKGYTGIDISSLKRMAGGASKEQFMFHFKHDGVSEPFGLVLRMDPLEGIVETCRLREAQLIAAMDGVVPLPPIFMVDPEGEHLGQPGVLMHFISGVTQPSNMDGQSVSGIGSTYGEYAEPLAKNFLKHLVAVHSWTDWDDKQLDTFVYPRPNTNDAARLQVNWWSHVWAMDKVEPVPLVTYAEQWLRRNAPVCDAPCVVHADFRMGNLMFDEPSCEITAVLDWELAHFGDFHEDLAWALQVLFGSWNEHGEFMVCNLIPRRQFLAEYERLSGRTINPETLKYYEVLNAWKCAVLDLSSAVMAAKNGNNHQDLLINWLAAGGAVFLDQIAQLIRGDQ